MADVQITYKKIQSTQFGDTVCEVPAELADFLLKSEYWKPYVEPKARTRRSAEGSE